MKDCLNKEKKGKKNKKIQLKKKKKKLLDLTSDFQQIFLFLPYLL